MKPSTKVTFSRGHKNPGEREGFHALMYVNTLCVDAFVFNLDVEEFPEGLEKPFEQLERFDIYREVADTSRMVGCILYHGDHMSLKIVFSKGGKDVYELNFTYSISEKRTYFTCGRRLP